MSKSRFPIEGKVLHQLGAIIGKKAAGKVARVCKSADFIASCESSGEVAEFLEQVFTDPDQREAVATKVWQWAKKLFGEYDGMTPMLRAHLDDIVGEQYADAVMGAFANWEEILAMPSEEAVAVLLDAVDDEEKRKRVAHLLYGYAIRVFSTPQPQAQIGCISIGEGSTITVGQDMVGHDKIVVRKEK